MDALDALKDTPIPALLAVAGTLLVIWSVINIELQIVSVKLPKPTTRQQRIVAVILGLLFLAAGVGLFVFTQPPTSQNSVNLATSTPIPALTETPMPTATPTATSTSTAIPPATAVVPRAAAVGGNRGEIIDGRADVWLYEGTPGEVLTIRVYADKPADTTNPSGRRELGLLDTTVELHQPNGTTLAESDDPPGDDVRSDSVIDAVELSEAGEYQIVVRSFENATSGRYTLILHSSTRRAQGLPDLTIAYIYKPTNSCDSAQVERITAKRRSTVHAQDNPPPIGKCFTVEVANLGGGASQSFDVVIVVPDGNGDALPATIPGLQPGASVEIEIGAEFYGEGSLELSLTVDSRDAVAEIDETNNSRTYILDVTVDG